MDTRPRFLSHICHALGSLANDVEIGRSNPGTWPISSPPPVMPRYVSCHHCMRLSLLTGKQVWCQTFMFRGYVYRAMIAMKRIHLMKWTSSLRILLRSCDLIWV
jgi:hypothetical protein